MTFVCVLNSSTLVLVTPSNTFQRKLTLLRMDGDNLTFAETIQCELEQDEYQELVNLRLDILNKLLHRVTQMNSVELNSFTASQLKIDLNNYIIHKRPNLPESTVIFTSDSISKIVSERVERARSVVSSKRETRGSSSINKMMNFLLTLLKYLADPTDENMSQEESESDDFVPRTRTSTHNQETPNNEEALEGLVSLPSLNINMKDTATKTLTEPATKPQNKFDKLQKTKGKPKNKKHTK